MESSNIEKRIHDILEEAGLPFEEEYTFPDLKASSGRSLRFDFAVFDDCGNLDFLIEAQGKQHYVPVGKWGGQRGLNRQRYNDTEKRKYCHKHNIKLIAIPYYDEQRVNYDYIMRAAGY